MANDNGRGISPFVSTQNVSSARVGSYVGAHADRQRRFEARSARRLGDWTILGVPTPILWLDDDFGLCLYDECAFAWPEVIELWP